MFFSHLWSLVFHFHYNLNKSFNTNGNDVFFFQSGASAGVVCDIVFFPLDTIKTRLQSQHGFQKSGGFTRIYQGIGPVIIGSAPAGI